MFIGAEVTAASDDVSRRVFGFCSLTSEYAYDASGNQPGERSSVSGVVDFTDAYDVADRLIEAKTDRVTVFEAYYDARARRIGKNEI